MHTPNYTIELSHIPYRVNYNMVDDSSSTHRLLPQSNSSSYSIVQPQEEDEKMSSSLSTTIEKCIGELNWTQFLQVVIVSLAWFFDGQQTFITIFTDSQPSWHYCTNHNNNKISDNVYPCNSSTTTTTSNMCNLPKDSWAWDGPTHSTIISEWGLECEPSIVTGLPTSMFFAGNLIGGLVLASLADSSLGRKNTLLLSSFLMSVSSLLASFSTNVWIYSALKFLCGFGRATIGTTSIVLASELVAKRWRGQIGAIGFFLFSIGFLTLPAIAYTNKDSSWRNLYLLTSIPAILYCILVHLLVHDSPRWLLIRGRKEEAVKILKSITSLSSSLIQSDLDLAISSMPLKEEIWNVDLYSAFKILMQKKWSSRRLLAIMAMGLGIGLIYYGMPLGLGMLSFNIYLSVAFNALSEIPSTFLAFMIIEKFNRRTMLLFLTILSGISSVLASIENYYTMLKGLQIVFELVSFLCACTAYDVAIIYGTELFPTSVRNSAVSLIRQAAVLGGTISPILVAVGRDHTKFLCYGVFGLVIMFSGLFGVCLPETKDKAFCDTMDEEESKLRVTYVI